MLKIIKMNYNKAHKRNCSALFGLVSELVLLVSNILILKSVPMTIHRYLMNRARTGSGLSDFIMVGLSDRLSDIRCLTFSCTICRVV